MNDEIAPPFVTRAGGDVLRERERQRERWTAAHDDAHHGNGQIACAAAVYAYRAGKAKDDEDCARPWGSQTDYHWPWALEWFKPRGRRRTLVKAAAMLIAEIERLDRQADREPAP